MIFSSYEFIFIFLPITLLGFYLLRRFGTLTLCKLWLVAASLVFYAQGDLRFLPILAGTVLFNWFFARLMEKNRERKTVSDLLLGLLIFENLGLLAFFKYTNFFLENAAALLGTEYIFKNILLPLGISFYTFQLLAFCVDCRRGKETAGSLLDFCVFATFFPQLIVGPILKRSDMIEQVNDKTFMLPCRENIYAAVMFFVFGCAKKILLADPLITHAQAFYALGSGSFFESWGAALSYTFAYYFDFSGYADMAVGLGLLFNVKLPFNFNSPYKAKDFADFWRRWNITVSTFFEEYIFKGIFHFGNRIPRLILATIVTFAVSGLWHGADWHFVVWGLVNGVFVCIANVMTLKRIHYPAWIGRIVTFILCVLVRVLFDATGVVRALWVYRGMFDLSLTGRGAAFWQSGMEYFTGNAEVCVLLVLSAIICFTFKNTRELFEDFKPKWYHPALAGALFTLSLFFMSTVSSFLYFQF